MDGRKKYRARRAIAAVMAAVMLCALFAGCEKRQIVAGVPGDGKQITTANAVVAEFCRDYTPGSSEELRDYEDMYYPAGVDLEWSYATEDQPLYAFVVVSRHKDPRAALAKYEAAAAAETAESGETAVGAAAELTPALDPDDTRRYVTAGASVHIDDLLVNTDYYWQVEAVYADRVVLSGIFQFHTRHDFRTLDVPKVSNTRDLGGYSAAGGKTVRQGMIYRGANVDGANADTRRVMLTELGIRTDLDLRAPGEGRAGGEHSPLGVDVNYINISAPLYLGIKEEEKQPALADEIRVFADEANYPVYFHCAIGRDRTGTLALLLLGLLGVPEDMIRRDYEMSFLSYSGSADKTPVKTMLDTNYEPTIAYIKTFEGKTFRDKTVNFLKSIGITQEEIDSIRSIMLR
ncbi:MAG: tyrosine-protein phosphatase [Clostridia bacterium]|nr:tyrosine-protein phosphatase [Clostridia bacterium]